MRELENTPLVLSWWGANSTQTLVFNAVGRVELGGCELNTKEENGVLNEDPSAEVSYAKFELQKLCTNDHPVTLHTPRRRHLQLVG